MATFDVTGPDGQKYRINAPEGASEQDVLQYAMQSIHSDPKANYAKALQEQQDQQMGEMSGPQKFLAGAGKAFTDVGRGVGQMLTVSGSPAEAAAQRGVDEARKLDAPLMQTGAGTAGNLVGNLAIAAPTIAIPGANTVGGAAAIGGALNALQPVPTGDSRLQNAAIGTLTAGGTQLGVGKFADMLAKRTAAAEAAGTAQAAQNSVKDETLGAGQQLGLVAPPSQANAGIVSRVMEGISGKAKSNQAMGIKNQNITDAVMRRELGLAADTPITSDSLQSLRDQAYKQGYEPLANAGAVETDTVYKNALDNIAKDYQGASRSFPGAVKNDVMDFVDGLRTSAFDMGDALKMTRILRDDAKSAFRQGDNALGVANRKAAEAIEGQVERSLNAAGEKGADLLKGFRDARKLIAKSHSVEDALVQGGGNVNAKALAAALERGVPMEGDMKTVAKFANTFRDVMGVPQSGWANPITALDAFQTAGMGALGAGPMSLALPIARVASRYAISNPAYQRAFVNPSYGPGILGKTAPVVLKKGAQAGLPGLLGAIYAEQQ